MRKHLQVDYWRLPVSSSCLREALDPLEKEMTRVAKRLVGPLDVHVVVKAKLLVVKERRRGEAGMADRGTLKVEET